MAKLDPSSPGPALFAPIVFRLAMKLEQARWSEFAEDPTEAVYVLCAAQRLFRQDAVVAWFDTWLEAARRCRTRRSDRIGATPDDAPMPNPAS